jgi:hypothetical protein
MSWMDRRQYVLLPVQDVLYAFALPDAANLDSNQ